jgi:hypothetical protein
MQPKDFWLNERRLRVYPRLFLIVYVGGLAYWVAVQFWLGEESITALRNDFAGFWSVGHMVLEGRASEAYDPSLVFAAEAAHVPEHEMFLHWFYPPQFFFLVGPLALLPYFAAFVVWVAATCACLAAATRAWAPHASTLWLFIASPGLIWILRYGQTGVLAAALLSGALYCMTRGLPYRAGILIGLLTFKPQLGVLIPFALIAGGQWRVFGVATLVTVFIISASTLVFGVEVWPSFIEATNLAMTLQSQLTLPQNQVVSLYAPLRTAGVSHETALALQIALGLTVLIVVLKVWQRFGICRMSGALLLAGSVLVSPHVLGYDLAVFAPAIAMLAWDGIERGWLLGERTSYIILWFWPLISGTVGDLVGIQIGIGGSLLLLFMILRRCRVMGAALPRDN